MKKLLSLVLAVACLTVVNASAQAATATFQYGVNGYTDTTDIQINQGAMFSPDTGESTISIDQSNGGVMTWGLLRFDSLFGSAAGQIPTGATITSATLTVLCESKSAGTISFYRMLQPWTADTTWASLGGTAVVDDAVLIGTETVGTADATLVSPEPTGALNVIDVTASLLAWAANPSLNYGWFIHSDATDGWDFASSEWATASERPLLTIEYTATAPVPVPAAAWLLGSGLMGLAGLRRRKA